MWQQMCFCLLQGQKITGFKTIFHMDSLNEYLSHSASIRGLCQWPLQSRVIALNTAALHFSFIREETLLSFWTLRPFRFSLLCCVTWWNMLTFLFIGLLSGLVPSCALFTGNNNPTLTVWLYWLEMTFSGRARKIQTSCLSKGSFIGLPVGSSACGIDSKWRWRWSRPQVSLHAR